MDANILSKDITIIVNSCDAYSDLWPAFFTLLKKYWNTDGVRVLLNTETKDYSFDGIDIECVHCPGKPYGTRMRHALKQIKTPYVISMLDDFFLRKPVENEEVNQLVRWMEQDQRIVYFNFDPFQTEYDLECPYEGFCQICPGTDYTLTMQLAIWRTEKLLSYWRDDITPWEWELFTDIKTCWRKADRFYRIRYPHLFDYGYSKVGEWMGVQRGKWVMEDVVPLFEKEGIVVDFEARNSNHAPVKLVNPPQPPAKSIIGKLIKRYKEVWRLLGFEGALHCVIFDFHRCCYKIIRRSVPNDFFAYTRNKTRAYYLARKTAQRKN